LLQCSQKQNEVRDGISARQIFQLHFPYSRLSFDDMNALSPFVSEFESVEQAEAYEAWLRAKVKASLSDDRPAIPHDEAMARIHKIIEEKSGAGARLAR
jgi:hypothetical protein